MSEGKIEVKVTRLVATVLKYPSFCCKTDALYNNMGKNLGPKLFFIFLFKTCTTTWCVFMTFQIGNGLPDLKLQPEILEAMRKAGFEVIEFKNGHRSGDLPW